jgi:hypothetical protein
VYRRFVHLRVTGGAVVCDDRLIHLAAFRRSA